MKRVIVHTKSGVHDVFADRWEVSDGYLEFLLADGIVVLSIPFDEFVYFHDPALVLTHERGA